MSQYICRCVAENAGGRAETTCNLTITPAQPKVPGGTEEMIEPETVKRAHAPPPAAQPMQVDEV